MIRKKEFAREKRKHAPAAAADADADDVKDDDAERLSEREASCPKTSLRVRRQHLLHTRTRTSIVLRLSSGQLTIRGILNGTHN